LNFIRTALCQKYQHRVKGCLVDHCVEGSLGEVHGFDVHEQIFKILALILVLFLHGLDADIRNINISDGAVSLLKHLLTEPRIARANIEYSIGLINMSGDDILEPTVSLVPVKRLGIPKIA